MNFTDLRERLLDLWGNLKTQVSENPQVMAAYEKFVALPASTQRLVVVGGLVLSFGLLIWVPLSYLLSSSTAMENFEGNRSRVHQLLQVSSKAKVIQQAPHGFGPADLQQKIKDKLESQRLLADQIASIQATSITTDLVSKRLESASVKAMLKTLNIDQVRDITYELQSLSPTTKVINIAMTPSSQKANYFDVSFDVISSSIPNQESSVVAPQKTAPAPRARRPRVTN